MPRTGSTGLVASLVFFALGAILYWAVADAVEGIDLSMIGLIVMGLSALGFVLSLGGWFASRSENERAIEVDREVGRPAHRHL